MYAKFLQSMSTEIKKQFLKKIVQWQRNPVLADRDNRMFLLRILNDVYEIRQDLKKFKPAGVFN